LLNQNYFVKFNTESKITEVHFALIDIWILRFCRQWTPHWNELQRQTNKLLV